MGGHGSGRKPDVLNSFLKQQGTKARPEIKQPIATDMFMPNLSGVASHPEATANFATSTHNHDSDYLKLDASNDPITGDLQIGKTTESQQRKLLVTDSGTGIELIGGGTAATLQSKGVAFDLTFKAGNSNDADYIFSSSGSMQINSMSSAGFVKNTAGGVLSGGNSIDISSDTNLVAGTNITLSGDTLNVDDAFIVNNADDTSTGKITAANFAVTGDNSSNDTEYVPMVLHGTDATPPTASSFPIGTIYIQYTA